MKKVDIKSTMYKNYETPGFKYISDSKGYFVSVSGDVFRLAGIYTRNPYFKRIKPTLRKDCYCIASIAYNHIYVGTDGKGNRYYKEGQRSMMIHRLIAEAFLGKCPYGCEVDHHDGHRWNNSLDNLDYITRGENRARKHGAFNYDKEKELFNLCYESTVCVIPPM